MKKIILVSAIILVALTGCNQNQSGPLSENDPGINCQDDCCKSKDAQGEETTLSCKLTSPELQERKATILTSLRNQIIEKKELTNGFAFRFNGSDKMIDELTTFAKTERQCCDFFTFNISITGDTSSLWFEITGVPETKNFIKTELEL